MGVGRIPGIYGARSIFGCILHHGPLGFEVDPLTEFQVKRPGVMGVFESQLVAPNPGVIDVSGSQDEAELKLLFDVYGAVKDAKARPFMYWKQKKKKYKVEDYVRYRNAYFGSAEEYQRYLAKSREELDADKEVLRKYLEPSKKVRNLVPEWKKSQNVFYAWVRKAYEKKLGDKVDVPKLIKSMMSESLKTALAKVKVDYGKEFQYGGFNPRPMKLEGYRLGTISEHAVGNALDIESSANAHIKMDIWDHILAFTSKSLDHSTRKAKWKSAPKELYESIKSLNDEFVARFAGAVQKVKDDAKKLASASGATAQQKVESAKRLKDPLKAAMADNGHLEGIGRSFLEDWGRTGFFNLPWDLVKELHEEGFLWGATFNDPDLHHFEL